jgi:hypothetical protein
MNAAKASRVSVTCNNGSKIIANNAVMAMGNISVTQNVNVNKKIAADTVIDEKPPHN